MALEDRVRALEEEVAILKDQIRHTLLEIQEQVLIHYYPELRANDSPPPDAALPARGGRGARPSGPAFSGLQRFAATEPEPAGEVLPGAGGLELGAAPARPAAQGAGDAGAGWAGISRLMEWASESAERIGRERTIRAIEASAQGGYLDLEAKDILVRLVALSDAEPAVERVSLRAIHDVLQGLNEILGRAGDKGAEEWLLEEARLG